MLSILTKLTMKDYRGRILLAEPTVRNRSLSRINLTLIFGIFFPQRVISAWNSLPDHYIDRNSGSF